MAQLHSLRSELENPQVEQEIDMIGLFRSILGTWRYLVVSLIVVTAIFGAVKAFQLAFQTAEATYSKPIRLTFPNAHKLLFPSGAKFAYGDIVAPAVVQIAYERNRLNDYGLTIADLQGGLSCIPYAPTYPLIMEKYDKLLSDKKLTVEQITDFQKAMKEEIDQAVSGEALITFRLDKKELPKDVVDKLLNDIPAIWAEYAMKDKGVLGINARLNSVSSLNMDLIKQADGLIAGDLLNEKLVLLTQNIRAMEGFEGSQSVADPVTGMKLADLFIAVDDLNRYVIGNLMAPIRLQGLSRDTKSSVYYYEDKFNKLKISLASLQRQSTTLQEIYNSYVQHERNSIQQGSDSKGGGAAVMPELSINMLEKLVSLSGDSAREKYKQQLNTQRLQLSKGIADNESALADAQLIFSALQKASVAGGKLSSKDEQYLDKVKSDLPQVLARISDYFGVSDRIYRQLSIESVGIRDQLYFPVTNAILVKKTLIDVKSTLLVWFALMFLTTIIVVPAFMIRNAMKQRGLTE